MTDKYYEHDEEYHDARTAELGLDRDRDEDFLAYMAILVREEEEEDERFAVELRKLYPEAGFVIPPYIFKKLPTQFSTEDQIVIKIPPCGCWYERLNAPPSKYIFVRRKLRAPFVTYRDVFDEIVAAKYAPRCDHAFLEEFKKVSDVQYTAHFGS
jgi:hypothetical protein